MILFFREALMGSGFASTHGNGQAAGATGHAQRQNTRNNVEKTKAVPQSAPSMPSAARGVKHYAHGDSSELHG
ncbi:hypothetical protein BOP93_05760 [Pseudomonas orientalis]|uniref:Uncharacterized protein n=1 Tax=Pseudomonas orientalis TaxID=76758 RepID=A0A2L0RSZ8_9PSED|nr:hypothetical protein BOP93_05760 [Pseudomonas orientalis]